MGTKLADHLPMYRQEKIFGRAGPPIVRSTLAQWVGNCGVQLQPLVDALRDAVLANMLETSSATGTGSWSAMTSLVTKPASNSA
jgi:transposase